MSVLLNLGSPSPSLARALPGATFACRLPARFGELAPRPDGSHRLAAATTPVKEISYSDVSLQIGTFRPLANGRACKTCDLERSSTGRPPADRQPTATPAGRQPTASRASVPPSAGHQVSAHHRSASMRHAGHHRAPPSPRVISHACRHPTIDHPTCMHRWSSGMQTLRIMMPEE